MTGDNVIVFPLRGPAGEPVDLWRTFVSHGVAYLPPLSIDEERRTLEMTLTLPGSGPRMVELGAGPAGYGQVRVIGPAPDPELAAKIVAAVGYVLRLEEDLTPFYAQAALDPSLSWATRGAGRMIRSPTVFEDVVKTICTTNCAWANTVRMASALVEHLGERAGGHYTAAAPESGTRGRAFPTPEAMAGASEDFYRQVVRAGYRGRYLIQLARWVHDGTVDLEVLGRASLEEIPDEEVQARLLALPGVGPYAAAHIMMMIGRYSRLILDSWTRPKYARLNGGEPVPDEDIVARFAPYGRYAGLAFWLYLTRDWVEETPP